MLFPFHEVSSSISPDSEPPPQQEKGNKIPFHSPQIGPLRHILQETGEKGKSKEYDSYSDNRP